MRDHGPGPGEEWRDYDIEAAFMAGYRLSDFGLIAEAVHRIDHRTSALQSEIHRLFSAWSAGGLRGLREAARGATNGRRD